MANEPLRVVFHRRGRDVETAWCVPLSKPNQYRLDNVLLLHEKPVCGDVIEARPARAFDGELAFSRVVKACGRHVMILDYPEHRDFARLSSFVRKRFDAVCEGCFGPEDGEPGRLYLAVPKRHRPSEVFTQAASEVAGLIGVHPKLGAKKTPKKKKKKKKKKVAAKRPVAKASLFDAVRNNDVAAFARLGKSDLGLRDEHGCSLLFHAVLEGRLEIVKRMIDAGAAVDPRSKREPAPLLAAAMRNRPKEAALLLASGAKPELASDKDGDPVLVTAAFRESLGVVRALLTRPHEATVKSRALIEAAGEGNLAIVKALVKHGADPNWKSKRGNTALAIARKRKQKEIVRYFTGLGRRPATSR